MLATATVDVSNSNSQTKVHKQGKANPSAEFKQSVGRLGDECLVKISEML